MSTRHLPVPTEFLRSSRDPWVRYRLRTWLEGTDRATERSELLKHPRVKALVAECTRWPAGSSADHKAAKDTLNKFSVLADWGLRRGDLSIDAMAERVLAHCDDTGRILNSVMMPRAAKAEWMFDIDGQDPLLALTGLGFADDPRIRGARSALEKSACKDGGWVWPDAPSPLPCRKFAGGCPYPTVKILRMLAIGNGAKPTKVLKSATELLLDLSAKNERRYGFGWADAFGRLRYPFVWFDILHVLEALSPYPWVWRDRRFRAILERVLDKADSEGRFTPESVYLEWKDLCFGQKREPSPWLTLIVHRIVSRDPASR